MNAYKAAVIHEIKCIKIGHCAADHILGYNLFKYSCQINSGQNLFIFTAPEFQTSPVGQCIKNNLGNDEKA